MVTTEHNFCLKLKYNTDIHAVQGIPPEYFRTVLTNFGRIEEEWDIVRDANEKEERNGRAERKRKMEVDRERPAASSVIVDFTFPLTTPRHPSLSLRLWR